MAIPLWQYCLVTMPLSLFDWSKYVYVECMCVCVICYIVSRSICPYYLSDFCLRHGCSSICLCMFTIIVCMYLSMVCVCLISIA